VTVTTQDRVIAVALPARMDPRVLDAALPPGCVRPSGGFDARRLPPEAAVATLTYYIAAGGAEQCPPDPAAKALADAMRDAMKTAPRCP